jgi:polyribonucleotide nucleotidyltransferase
MGIVFALVALTLGTSTMAQEATEQAVAGSKDAIELTRAEIQTDRQAIVTAAMDFTEPESKAFWPLYREYRDSLAKVGDRKVALITDFAKNYETLTDEQAKSMTKEMFDIQDKELSVRRDYVKKMEKVLPPKKLARFCQVENKLDSVINYELAGMIPLAKTK